MKSLKSKVLYRPRRAFLPHLVLLIGLLFTFIVYYYLSKVAAAEDRVRFNGTTREVEQSIEGRIETYIALLRAGTGLFAGSESVTHGEFKDFVRRLDLAEHYPGVQGIGFSVRLGSDQDSALFEKVLPEGMLDSKVSPDARAGEGHAIIYLEPLDRRNLAAMGYDMSGDPVRRAAMDQARDTGRPAASGSVQLVQEIDEKKQAGFVIYAPVYRNGSPITNESERRGALIGFVFSPFRVDDLLYGILPTKRPYLDFKVYEGTENAGTLIHDSTQFSAAVPDGFRPRFFRVATINVAGRQWTITFTSRPELDQASGQSYVPYTVTAGVLLSLLLFGLTRSQARARQATERSAAEMKHSEATIRKTLVERERAEAALRESEERYRELVENANDIVYTLDLDGKITSINKAGELITGFSRDELLNSNLTELLSPSSFEAATHMLDRKLAGEERTNYELDFCAKSGAQLTLEISSRLTYKDGAAVGVQGIARDITTRRRAEEALREADQRALSEYERLLERISGLAQTLGTARDLITIFRGLKEFTLVSVPCDGLFVSLYDAVRDVRTACYGWGDGTEIDTSELPPMPVTAMGPNSRAVRTGEVIITHDYMNATRGHPAVLVGPDNGLRPQSSLVVPMAVMGRIIGTIEIQSYEKAGYSEEHVTAMRMAANLSAVAIENVGLLERESNARATAEESNRLKDEFLATVSHELRTPLTAILGWSRMLEGGSLDDEAAARAIETIRRNAKAQSQIIDDILDVSRIITGNLYLDLHPLELGPVVEAAVNVVRPTAEAKGIQIELHLESQPTVVSGDGNRLQQVIWNLVSNAVKFTPVGGHVRVHLRQRNSYAEIEVEDTGKGISAEFLPFVFDRFRQADSTTTRQHGGLGLGLAIARHLVEIHGGTIQARSAGEEKGASFVVCLPLISHLAGAPYLPAERSVQVATELAGLHVLVVDDDRDTLEWLTAALTQQSARVTAASSAGEALELMKLLKPDVLVSDIAMPGADGYQLIKQIRAMKSRLVSSIPAVAITAYAKEEDRQRALSCGYQHYLAKPIELSELLSVVAEVAEQEQEPARK
ncbi:MAG TPA: CHASE domain-containing protein [Pyrinomonadaceae bacterium]|nr:CHASE domain-containing protein [Pyrinomonadaceae bacterium]